MCKYGNEENICPTGCKCMQETKPMFAVGDKVYSLVHGQGVVDGCHSVNPKWKTMRVKFGEMVDWYWPNGKYHSNGEQVLFHDKPTIIPAKKKVKKYVWAFRQIGGLVGLSDMYSEAYVTSKYRDDWCDGAVKLPWTEIEVEE